MKKQGEEIIQQNSELLAEMKDIRTFSQGKPQNFVEQSLNETLFEPLEGFPLQTVEQFENLNSKINIKLRKSLYNHLKLRGGTKLREFLSLALKMTMSDQLVAKFTWRGDKKHKKFGNTRVANVMFVAAKYSSKKIYAKNLEENEKHLSAVEIEARLKELEDQSDSDEDIDFDADEEDFDD